MKANIELNMPDERTFLNFWNAVNGEDIVCEIIDGKLMLNQYDEKSVDLPSKEITFIEFADMVRESVISQIEYLKNKL